MATDKTSYGGPDRRAPPSLCLGLLVACIIVGIGVATLGPIGLRPRLGDANLERFGAFFVLGAALCLFTPRRWPAALAFVVFLAVSLEFGQNFAPGRDAHTSDAMIKVLGGVSGVLSVRALLQAVRGLLEQPHRHGAAGLL